MCTYHLPIIITCHVTVICLSYFPIISQTATDRLRKHSYRGQNSDSPFPSPAKETFESVWYARDHACVLVLFPSNRRQFPIDPRAHWHDAKVHLACSREWWQAFVLPSHGQGAFQQWLGRGIKSQPEFTRTHRIGGIGSFFLPISVKIKLSFTYHEPIIYLSLNYHSAAIMWNPSTVIRLSVKCHSNVIVLSFRELILYKFL